MNLSLVAAKQVGALLIAAALGFFAKAFGVIDKNGTAKLYKLLIYIAYPLLIIVSFGQKFSKHNLQLFGTVFVIALVLHVLATAAALLLFRKNKRPSAAAYRFCLVFSGCGFVGLPLLKAIFVEDGAFYGASYLLFSSLWTWLFAPLILSSGRKAAFGTRLRALVHPAMIAAALGFLLFLCHIRLPQPVATAFGAVGDMSFPLAMLILGSMAGELPFKALFFDAGAYVAALVKLLALPLAVLAFCMLFRVKAGTAYVCVVMAALPASVTAPFAAAEHGADRSRALACAVLTTLLSLATLPLVLYAMKFAF